MIQEWYCNANKSDLVSIWLPCLQVPGGLPFFVQERYSHLCVIKRNLFQYRDKLFRHSLPSLSFQAKRRGGIRDGSANQYPINMCDQHAGVGNSDRLTLSNRDFSSFITDHCHPMVRVSKSMTVRTPRLCHLKRPTYYSYSYAINTLLRHIAP